MEMFRSAETREEHIEPYPVCPKCGSDDTDRGHHEPNALAPECDYWYCLDCDHQWDHE